MYKFDRDYSVSNLASLKKTAAVAKRKYDEAMEHKKKIIAKNKWTLTAVFQDIVTHRALLNSNRAAQKYIDALGNHIQNEDRDARGEEPKRGTPTIKVA